MVKVRNPLLVHGVIKSAVDELGGAEAVADILTAYERKAQWVRAATNPDLEGRYRARPLYEEIRALTRAGARAFAEDLARLCGMQLVPIEAGGASNADLMSGAASLMSEAGEAVATVASSLSDGVISEHERNAMRVQLMEAMAAAQKLMDRL
ncbi:hypothetical protein Q1W73_16590 [Asticcacaulis sp. ZE23SCel15]|uniref:phage regulatory CII family protein n=1 Tax=Asticcacaulis sp. ZE23SCel15 TaxID=3059027 RepID=UPI00265DE352|nr:phage regulatory CII family protein [Asticcacaulis sp. ZE23SCel15]WKL57262.1 hypothetical protein Q1W73_16590 [Asticcacaulis sp. ZE23SCel15]